MPTPGGQRGTGHTRVALRERLEARREEIEATALTRVRAISDPDEIADPAYAEGLRAAVSAAVDYGIETTGREGSDPPIPLHLLAQARMAARAGIPLDTVLRRYFAGYSLLGYFILEEASCDGLIEGAELRRLLAAEAGVFDRLIAAIGAEHAREGETLRASSECRHEERIERLLAGEQLDTAEIAYEFAGWHVGLLADGSGADQSVLDLVAGLDCRLLHVRREEGTVWAWLGGRHRLDPDDLRRRLTAAVTEGGIVVGLGEPAEDVAGWRLTHRQAAAALTIAKRSDESVARYHDIALLASAIKDDLLVTSLRRLYLEPLDSERDGGRAARETLRAYFSAAGNITAASAALGVNRRTVSSRLAAIEAQLGKALESVSAEIEIALRLERIDDLAV